MSLLHSNFDHLRFDLSQRWHNGEIVQVEHYLAQYPELTHNVEGLLALIFQEAMLREERGETPQLDEYLDRFPNLAEHLHVQWKWQRILQNPIVAEGTESDLLTAPTPLSLNLPNLPGIELIREIGRGGMGIVFLAQQIELQRPVAIKFMRTGPFAVPEELKRFQTEAVAVARLRHRHAVQIYAAGTHQGYRYLVMEYLSGGSLWNWLRNRSLPIREAASMLRDLARAMRSAHEQGILHRDLKPSNILLDEHGTAKIGDFGLARLMDIDSELTCTEMVLGTPAYMSPEQAHGNNAEVGPHSDIWALGAILYECLVGRPPFKGKSRAETLQLVRTAEPDSLVAQRSEIPPELEAICLHCLQKDPKQRYGSAAELADDLEAWLAGRPTRVHPPTWPRRLLRTVRRHSGTALAGFTALALLVLTGIGLFVSDPNRPLRQIESELKLGQLISLLNEQHWPLWSKEVLGKSLEQRSVDGAFECTTNSKYMLELLPKPPKEGYRFRASIRQLSHDEHEVSVGVGLYVGRIDFSLEGRPAHYSLRLMFNELVDEGQKLREQLAAAQPGFVPPKEPPMNRVKFEGVFSRDPPQDWQRKVSLFSKNLFHPSTPKSRVWRKLELVVTPQEVRASFNGTAVGSMSAQHISKYTEGAWKDALKANPHLGQMLCPGRLDSAGGLGLVILGGTAQFKDIKIEPLLPE